MELVVVMRMAGVVEGRNRDGIWKFRFCCCCSAVAVDGSVEEEEGVMVCGEGERREREQGSKIGNFFLAGFSVV
jgi:hypothetical protein